MGKLTKKTCSRCNKMQPVENFHNNSAMKDGLSIWCKDCKSKNAAKYNSPNYVPKKRAASLPPESSGVILTPAFLEAKEKTPLDFLGAIQKTSRLNWSYDEALGLVSGLKRAFDKGAIDLKKCYTTYAPNKSYGACNALIKELKQALAARMSLEDYWKTGRKFRAGAKVLVEAKTK